MSLMKFKTKIKYKSMKKLIRKIWVGFLEIFGNIKIFKYPMFIVYDPEYFKMNGEKIK